MGATWDYEHAYSGGPPVAVAGFPRPLYPPDATGQGHRPSTAVANVGPIWIDNVRAGATSYPGP